MRRTALNAGNEFIGWGPPVADALKGASEHPDAIFALIVAGFLVSYAHWRGLLRLVGVHEKPVIPPPSPPWWENDNAVSDQVHAWLRPTGSSLTDKPTVAGTAFGMEVRDQGRAMTILKPDGAPILMFSARVSEFDQQAHDLILGMPADAYRAMQGDVMMELAKTGVGIGGAERLIPERGAQRGPDGEEVPVGVFFAQPLPLTELTPQRFVETLNSMHRLILIVQVVLGRHIREEAARVGETIMAAIGQSPVEIPRATQPSMTSTSEGRS